MSESGEMSEFGYIMELLAKGKVSASPGGLGLGSRLGTQGMRLSLGIRAVRAGGTRAGSLVCAPHRRIPAVHNAPWLLFLYVEERGLFEPVGHSGVGSWRERMGT